MKETRTLEYKETVTNTFLKTVSAFANYQGGQILFGIADDGTVKGLENTDQACLDIENKINDSIVPQPNFTLSVQHDNKIICLEIQSGYNKPYLYKSKAYKRNDTATIEVDALEFRRLVLEGQHRSFEELPAENQNLSFTVLADYLHKITGIEKFDRDIMKTLNLYSDQGGYNNAAAILADDSTFPGIDIAKFGENISIIQKRATCHPMSILAAYEKALALYRDYYQYEQISDAERKLVERIPEAAFREAVANAMVHRLWDVPSHIQISMFDDKIEIVSPGGLPGGISEQEYLSGRISVLRNPIIANICYRLKIVEIFGTGILRIQHTYQHSIRKPVFNITENAIKITLPVAESAPDMTDTERQIYQLLSKTIAKPISEIMPQAGYGKSKVSSILKTLEQKGIVTVDGSGRGTKYRLR